MFQMRPGRGKDPRKRRSVLRSLFSVPGNDFLPQDEEGPDGTGQKHSIKAIEYHGRHSLAFRQETTEQQNEDRFHRADSGGGGDHSGERLA